MRFTFKTLDYQSTAVESVVRVFEGQPRAEKGVQLAAQGELSDLSGQMRMLNTFVGFGNSEIILTDEELSKNIASVQRENIRRLRKGEKRDEPLGRVTLDIEMETGTGKTYVYTKAIHELYRRYGWTKFIIITPSVAIREGVKKSLEMTASHFYSEYGTNIRAFIYSGTNLTEIHSFASGSGINVMIINTQAFAASFNEKNQRSKVSRIIYSRRDNFGSYRPIDIIAATRPILILDEPQKMGGVSSVTQQALKAFSPLFSVNCSATHALHHSTVYTLDALDAYNKKLVKRIEVKEVAAKNLPGAGRYMYLSEIITSMSEAPRARLELEISYESAIKREYRIMGTGADLYAVSHGMEQYRGFVISEIDAESRTVKFTNGAAITMGELIGDTTDTEMRRIQIRETIRSHLEKEQRLFELGVKTLSLFFIDEVAKYRAYDESGTAVPGEYAKMFEEEYAAAVLDMRGGFSPEYCRYIDRFAPSRIHKGYFSIDRHGHAVNSTVRRGKDTSDDISAYDLILKDKERLLGMQEPTRFIFSHSALREGWDNPNIFQICFLKKGGDSRISKRQEIGRGMRIAVNGRGERMDERACEAQGLDVHKVNLLTIIAGESYTNFAAGLQDEYAAALFGHPDCADAAYFEGQVIVMPDGREVTITAEQARRIADSLEKLGYIDSFGKLTNTYHADSDRGAPKLKQLPDDMHALAPGIKKLLDDVVDEHTLQKIIPPPRPVLKPEPLNARFDDPRFQALWRAINHKYTYRTRFKSPDLVQNSIRALNDKLNISALRYSVTSVTQKKNITVQDLQRHRGFTEGQTVSIIPRTHTPHRAKYDLVSRLASATKLTRRTITAIMRGLDADTFAMYARNPEEFIKGCTRIISEEKSRLACSHIEYSIGHDCYSRRIFEDIVHIAEPNKIIAAKKSIQDHVYVDSNVEGKFARALEHSRDIALYAKLPRGFSIPTPVGRYSPDWAIVFCESSAVRKIYFIAETKGTMSEIRLREEEKIKIACAKSLFKGLFADKGIVYSQVNNFETLLDYALA